MKTTIFAAVIACIFTATGCNKPEAPVPTPGPSSSMGFLPVSWDVASDSSIIPVLGGTGLPTGSIIELGGQKIFQVQSNPLLMKNLATGEVDTTLGYVTSPTTVTYGGGTWLSGASSAQYAQYIAQNEFGGAYALFGTCPPVRTLHNLTELESVDSVLEVFAEGNFGTMNLRVQKLPVHYAGGSITVGSNVYNIITTDSLYTSSYGGNPVSFSFTSNSGKFTVALIANSLHWYIPE